MRIGAGSTTGWRATVAVAMSNYLEAGSIIAIATSLGRWQAEFGIGDAAIGVLAAVSANAFGAAAGAALGGPLCDRYGRKAIYAYDLLVYMAGVSMAAMAVSPWMLLVGFIITGIAVGAGVPASWTYIAEEAPPRQRAKHVGSAQLAWSCGPLVGFALAAALAPLGLVGSRLVFAHLFVIAAVVWWCRQGLPESAIWAGAVGGAESKVGQARRGIRGLFGSRVNLVAMSFLFGVYGLWGIVAGQAGIFMHRIYDAAGVHGVIAQDLLQVLVWGLTATATWFGFMRHADRVSQRALYGVGAALGVAGWVVLVYFGTIGVSALVVFAVLWGVSCGVGAQAFYGLWTSELFATPYRASAQGILFFACRSVIGVLSFFFPFLLSHVGLVVVGSALIGTLGLALVMGVIWAPATQGKTLREIEVERYGGVVEDDGGALVR